jgi:hypothetical protein
VGTGRTGAEGSFPSSVDAGPFNRFAAGTFEFKPLETPGPGTQHGGTAYIVPELTAGNQDNYPGSIGMDFNANGAIRITALGVFDDLSDGLTRTIAARLHDRQTEEVLATLEFTPADSGVLEGGSRFKDLSPALELPAGFQGCIVAEGYGAGERNGNAFGAIVWTTDDGGCLLSFVGSGRFHVTPAPPATFPDILDGGPPNRYAGGTFKFEPSTPVKIFHRGDPNNDGAINITDGIYILNYLFLGGPKPTCLEAANPNDDASINITDGIYVLNYLFLGGPPPVAPGPTALPCGPDRAGSPTNLGCDVYTKC